MNKKILLCILCIFSSIHLSAKSYILSTLPLPKTEILSIEHEECDEKCLKKFYENGEVFSYVAEFDSSKIEDSKLQKYFKEILINLGILEDTSIKKAESTSKTEINIALIVPKKIIGRYSTQSISTILAYLVTKNSNFTFEVFDSVDENIDNIKAAYKEAKSKDYDFAIGIFTLDVAPQIVQELDISMPLYLPTINLSALKSTIPNIKIPKKLYFGGIDYESQIELALSFSSNSPLVVFNDESTTGARLGDITRSKTQNIIHEESINRKKAASFGVELEKYENILNNKYILFNTQWMNSGLIISQLALAKKKPRMLLSVQLNYNPDLLMLIKEESEIQNLYIISSIGNIDKKLAEYTFLLGSDIRYNWVNYSTALGVENMFEELKDDDEKFFKERLKDHQINYTNRIYKATIEKSFVVVD